MRVYLIVLLMLVSLFTSGTADAHALPGTAVALDFRRADVGINLEIPLDQLELGFKHSLMDEQRTTVMRDRAALSTYFLQHIQAVAPDGRPWAIRVIRMRPTPASASAPLEVNVDLVMAPPPGAPVRKFRFNYSIINHEVMTHTVMVFARNDWNNGVFAAEPELLGTIRWVVTGINVDRSAGTFWRGMGDVIQLGMLHIAEGTDHLLFLLALLLPAPLLASGRRWGGYGGARYALVRLAKLVTAFTLGHSLTLIIGGFGNIRVPTTPVEVAIALSIFISALHAWRPLLHGREAWVAAGFGLIHGLAFSQIVAGAGLDGWHKAAAVFGFNIGIEVVQLAVVAVTAPWLILLAKSGKYTPVRVGGAAFAAIASLAWMLERATGQSNPISESLSGLLSVAPYAIVCLAIWAVVAVTVHPRPTTV